MCICIYTLDISTFLSYYFLDKGLKIEAMFMKTVNALKVRNNLGEVLDFLTNTGEPVLVSKGREIRAVLITPEDFKKRFLDLQTEENKKKLLATIKSIRSGKVEKKRSIDVLREFRGYVK